MVGPAELNILSGKGNKVITSHGALIENLPRLDSFEPDELTLVLQQISSLCRGVEDFLTQAQTKPADFYYPIIEKRTNEAKYPIASALMSGLEMEHLPAATYYYYIPVF